MKFTTPVVIGLEVHAEINTATKLFCSCPTSGSEEPNTRCCNICLGHPGSKPVLNKKAVEFAIKLCLALNCKIAPELIFSRKSYFYPDLSKNFQITQYEIPLGEEGSLKIPSGKEIGLTRIHMEEDPASLIHPSGVKTSSYVLVDYNRSGNPLLEIVTKPEMTTPQEARDFMKQLITILSYLEIFDENNGIIKADANVSIKESKYTRVEIKNITGFKEIETALRYEIVRQQLDLEKGKKIVQETRGWDSVKATTYTLRKKETEEDYGYIIDTDLVPTEITKDWISQVKKTIPELAQEKSKKFVDQGVKKEDADVLSSNKKLAELYDKVSKKVDPVLAAKWLRRELMRVLNYHKKTLDQVKITEEHLIDLLKLIESKKITENVAQKILEQLVEKPFDVKDYIKSQKLETVSDSGELDKFCDEAIKEAPQAVEDYKQGQEKALNFVIGLVMKKTRGKASPDVVKKLLIEKLK
tara:strand:+ start:21364 stop:22773 length:1410 start_codon:yes stop_codon:yes gene_type:complete